MRNGWKGEPSALAKDIMRTPGQGKVVEKLKYLEEIYKEPLYGEVSDM